MASENYLLWVANETPTVWWHDSADPQELRVGLERGAVGVTCNPVLTYTALKANPDKWGNLPASLPKELTPSRRAEELMRHVVSAAAEMYRPIYERTDGENGYVCAQVNPNIAWDAEAMTEMGRRFSRWAPNIAVKLPVTLAGLEALEVLTGEGVTVTATVSYNVPQMLQIAEFYERGRARAAQAGIRPGRCFAVQMIGRLDDYLRDVAIDNHAKVTEEDIRQAGLAMAKRAYGIYRQKGYKAKLLVAALRGTYHMTELAGAELVMSIHPRYQEMLLQPGVPREERIDRPIDPQVIARLQTMPEFVRSYEPDGMEPKEFISFGLVQRTL
ncbi:MAG: transaldolase family protein, partial [Chloroflexi bacterium]|nr:transaldolase family protein [Chloroflexota bacterium]